MGRNSFVFLTFICQPVSSLHLAGMFSHQARVEVNKQSPGGLRTLFEAVENTVTDARAFSGRLKAMGELVG